MQQMQKLYIFFLVVQFVFTQVWLYCGPHAAHDSRPEKEEQGIIFPWLLSSDRNSKWEKYREISVLNLLYDVNKYLIGANESSAEGSKNFNNSWTAVASDRIVRSNMGQMGSPANMLPHYNS